MNILPGVSLVEGVSARATTSDPICHLLVNVGSEHSADWRMWCTGGDGHPHTDPPDHARLCGECRRQARSSDLDAHSVNRICIADPLSDTPVREWIRTS